MDDMKLKAAESQCNLSHCIAMLGTFGKKWFQDWKINKSYWLIWLVSLYKRKSDNSFVNARFPFDITTRYSLWVWLVCGRSLSISEFPRASFLGWNTKLMAKHQCCGNVLRCDCLFPVELSNNCVERAALLLLFSKATNVGFELAPPDR